jgi:hypothetical protein
MGEQDNPQSMHSGGNGKQSQLHSVVELGLHGATATIALAELGDAIDDLAKAQGTAALAQRKGMLELQRALNAGDVGALQALPATLDPLELRRRTGHAWGEALRLVDAVPSQQPPAAESEDPSGDQSEHGEPQPDEPELEEQAGKLSEREVVTYNVAVKLANLQIAVTRISQAAGELAHVGTGAALVAARATEERRPDVIGALLDDLDLTEVERLSGELSEAVRSLIRPSAADPPQTGTLEN